MANPNAAQLKIARNPLDAKIFLSGSAGSGKTTVGVERMKFLLKEGIQADSILVLTPQRTLQEPYIASLRGPETAAGGEVTLATVGGLARRMLDLFWPLASEAAGFAHPDRPPVFLTLETAQYYMAYIVRPLLDEGYFDSVTIDRNRLYSQIIDNMNKSAVIGFPVDEIGTRLDSAWFGDPGQRRVYSDAQDCALRFRQYCLDHNLLDFSLQMDVFWNSLWSEDHVRDYLTRTYRHLIYDNLEEDSPRGHDLVREWLASLESALLIYDQGAGYRRFLGADPQVGWALRELCDEQIVMQDSFVVSEGIGNLVLALEDAILPDSSQNPDLLSFDGIGAGESQDPLSFVQTRFYPELLDAITQETATLLNEGLAPSEIVILAPYLSDALRFSLTHRLDVLKIPWRSHRPSRSLRDEPASQALLTLAALAHPHWNIRPPKFDVGYALMHSIEGLDLVRAQLLTEIIYRQRDFSLAPFDGIKPDVQERITYSFGNRYSTLREWLQAYRESDALPLDHFLRKLFGEVLSQPGFGFHSNIDSVRVAANLIESIKKFRMAMEPSFVKKDTPDFNIGKEYIAMLNEGVLAAQYLESWQTENEDAILVAPAYTYLMMNKPVTVQFWLDAGSSGWYERLAQPITHPYVLARGWEAGRLWTDSDEVEQGRISLARLVTGLLRRCKQRLYLGMSELGESGYEQRGDLLKAFQKILQGAS
ncbi:MAG: UvrD-helicase domain-containing protein [Anaerolineae bacterium]|nr:UvrD-helicase domain-containing protein [Anaerolineae bacterium]